MAMPTRAPSLAPSRGTSRLVALPTLPMGETPDGGAPLRILHASPENQWVSFPQRRSPPPQRRSPRGGGRATRHRSFRILSPTCSPHPKSKGRRGLGGTTIAPDPTRGYRSSPPLPPTPLIEVRPSRGSSHLFRLSGTLAAPERRRNDERKEGWGRVSDRVAHFEKSFTLRLAFAFKLGVLDGRCQWSLIKYIVAIYRGRTSCRAFCSRQQPVHISNQLINETGRTLKSGVDVQLNFTARKRQTLNMHRSMRVDRAPGVGSAA